ncbi:cupin domain-containing protein [Vibrio kanaloae]|uniref:cupin domain-containing protein n=1 Tax=Vibrio kanaloae TaxID=170673 RepID=UPI0010BD893D|nr:cupin domain-containing protein [Vibrio kanaloae]TKF03626.1 cupin domain-containing protein [Vibrio kanaloae]TKF64573.1 cupin domain-containing protein [Vibrio kanaloae]
MTLQNTINNNLVRYMELIPGTSAFIDARTPGSDLKDNFCIIGAGVAESSRQHVHIRETAGFNIGAAGQPPGIKNSLHSHHTAELFVVFKGQFRFYWGNEGEHEAVLSHGDVISIPTNLFRGFEVVGRDYGFMYSVLGGDNSGGGVVWHPSVITDSQGYGLYLKADGTLVDTIDGDAIPNESDLMPLLTSEELSKFDTYTAEQMMPFVALKKDYREVSGDFDKPGVKQFALTGHPSSDYDFQVKSVDDVSIMAYELTEGASIPVHKRSEKQVLINFEGDTLLNIVQDGEQAQVVLTTGDVFSVPDCASYSLENLRGTSFTYVVLGSDQPQTV